MATWNIAVVLALEKRHDHALIVTYPAIAFGLLSGLMIANVYFSWPALYAEVRRNFQEDSESGGHEADPDDSSQHKARLREKRGEKLIFPSSHLQN